MAYTASGQLASYTDCSAKTSTWQYGARGELVKFANAAGEATQYQYEGGQLASVSHPDGRAETFERDAAEVVCWRIPMRCAGARLGATARPA